VTRRELGARLVRMLENCKLTAYWDARGKVWTIGYGHTSGVTEGMTCTLDQAEQWLVEDFDPLDKVLPETISVVRGAALLSFGLNCGAGALSRVVSGDIQVTPDGFLTRDGHLYGQTSGNVLINGLVSRRRLEAGLYLSG